MIDPDVQRLVERDLADLLSQLAKPMTAEDIALIRELIDHGETEEALRIMLWAHTDNALPVTVDQQNQMRHLAERMGLASELAQDFDLLVTT